jgi:hypothetical protein
MLQVLELDTGWDASSILSHYFKMRYAPPGSYQFFAVSLDMGGGILV